jgi:ribonuclease P/MRP protein subunit RPP1
LLFSENHLFSDTIWYIQLLDIYNNTFYFQLLVDWTKGKNLIISSAAHTASQIRGPYDVINLSAYLLGIPIDRAKAAMSTNCR